MLEAVHTHFNNTHPPVKAIMTTSTRLIMFLVVAAAVVTGEHITAHYTLQRPRQYMCEISRVLCPMQSSSCS